jgi:thioredoxin-like negative regulator of GroEL
MNVLFFTAPWCTTCKGVKPHVISACADVRVNLAFIDTDADPDAAVAKNISSLPTIIIERDGIELDRIVGAIGKSEMAKRLTAAKGEI